MAIVYADTDVKCKADRFCDARVCFKLRFLCVQSERNRYFYRMLILQVSARNAQLGAVYTPVVYESLLKMTNAPYGTILRDFQNSML